MTCAARPSILDLFCGAAGGWSLGMHRAGFLTVAACELIPWRRALFSQNNPGVTLYDDVRHLTAERLVRELGWLPDAIVGSPPCQDISSANTKGQGVDGERSGLYFEAVRLVGECRPRWFAFENSANLRTRGADRIVAAFQAINYALELCVVGADNVEANHERKRSWLIGYDPDQVTDPRGWQLREQPGRGSRPDGASQALDGYDDPPIAPADADGLGRHEGWSGWWGGFNVPLSHDLGNADGVIEGQVGEFHGGPESLNEGGADEHSTGVGCIGRRARRHGADGDSPSPTAPSARDLADADQTGQADGCLVAGIRQEEIADDGRGHERGADVADADRDREPDGTVDAEMGGGESSGGFAGEPWPHWNGGLAHHLRMDDGLSPWVAGSRIAVGGPRGTVAASLLVEAFGDAVLPQITEGIGRSILRTDAALRAVYCRGVSLPSQQSGGATSEL